MMVVHSRTYHNIETKVEETLHLLPPLLRHDSPEQDKSLHHDLLALPHHLREVLLDGVQGVEAGEGDAPLLVKLPRGPLTRLWV